MKVYILPNRVTLVGKAWQIRHKLKQYGKEYTTVQEWITATKSKRLSTLFLAYNKNKEKEVDL